MNSPHPHHLVIGLDRSDTKADLHLIDTTTGQSKSLTISTSPEALHEWLAHLHQEHPQASVGICLEQPAANLILFLEPYAWITLYPVNPMMVKNFRETFITSRANTDATDSFYAAQLLLAHPSKLKAWLPDDDLTRELQQLVTHRRAVIDERTGLSNRLQGLLKQYFPQALQLAGDELWRPLGTDFLLKWPTLQKLQKARLATIREFYRTHGSHSPKLLARRLELVERAVPLTDQRAVLESLTLRVQLICRQLQSLQSVIEQFDRRIKELFRQHPDREIFASLPGAGPTLAPRLLAAMGAERERFPRISNLQGYSGIAPVTKQSGGKRHVHRRYQCPKFYKQGFHEYAKESILWCRWAAAFYMVMRQRGAKHHTAVRALAYKWQRIIWRCWQNRVPYKNEIYEQRLRETGSPILEYLERIDLGKSPMKTLLKKSK